MMADRVYRVGLWCAVSSKQQATEDKVSLEAQEEAGRAFAEAIGGQAVRVYRVPGHTRDIIFWADAERDMEAYRQLREDVQAGVLDILHVVDPDRLGRDPALSNQVVSLVEKSGGEVYFATAPHVIGQKGAGSRYVFAIQSTRAGEDQARRVVYHERGMTRRTSRGLHPGIWPYGYRPLVAGGRCTGAEFDDNIGAVRMITKLYLSGAPLTRIARELNASPWRPVRAKTWGRSSVWRIMQNDTYGGYIEWGGKRSDHSDRFPALWDGATFAAILRERKRRDSSRHRRESSRYHGVVYCDECGSITWMTSCIHHATGQRFYRYQRCPEHPGAGVNHETLDEVLADFLDVVLTPDGLAGMLAQLQPDDSLTGRLEQIARDVEQVERQRVRAGLGLASGVMDAVVYQQVDGELVARLDGLRQEQGDIERELALSPSADALQAAWERVEANRAALFELEPLHFNAVVRDAGIKIWIRGGEVVRVAVAVE